MIESFLLSSLINSWPSNNWTRVALLGLGIVVVTVVVSWLLSRRFGWRSNALLRLDWYLPVLRKAKAGRTDTAGPLRRFATRLFPGSFFSDRTTKQRGLVRRMLRRLGPTWLSAPVRRCVQALCLLTFLGLFCYACWPYDARPLPPGWIVTDWSLVDIEQETGNLWLSGKPPEERSVAPGSTIWLAAPLEPGVTRQEAYQTVVTAVHEDEISLLPVVDLPDTVLATLITEPDDKWELHQRDPNAWPEQYATNLQRKEWIPAEFFLAIDPLVSLSTAVASRSWVWSLISAGGILLACIFVPRGFCGYLCPLGTTIDLFDWAIGKRVTRFRVPADGWWVHIKYYLLFGTLVSAVFGVLVSGFVSAIPVITRAALMILDPLQTGLLRGTHLIPAVGFGHVVSLVLFLVVLGLGFLQPRFWCKYVCPSGATFSLGNLFRATERKVESSCIHCNKCVEVCPFDAIKPDFTTRVTDCTLCQTCAGVCPTHAIKFVDRGNRVELKVLNDPPTKETAIGRRGFLTLAAGSAAAVGGGAMVAGVTKSFGAGLDDPSRLLPIRPPGSVPEKEFLEMCIRCGECFKVCPNNVLQVQGFEQGLEGLWSPVAKPDWAGCESSCNACGQVCPTGAIRALPLEEKRHARMGLAFVNEATCLPFAGVEDCDLCVVECQAAGYDAIEYQQVGTEVDDRGVPIAGTGYLAPIVIDEKCVGCGLCQTRCNGINVKEKHLLSGSAIVVKAGEDNEDRMMTGSYIDLHRERVAGHKTDAGDAASSSSLGTHGDAPAEDGSSTPAEFGDNPFGL